MLKFSKRYCAFANNLNYDLDYVIRDTVLKFNRERKFLYEEDHILAVSNNKTTTYYLNVNSNTICKTCKGLGWLTDNNLKGIKNELSNQIKFKLCPECQ